MKKQLALLLLLISCAAPKQETDPTQTVKDFLNWYGIHYKEVNSFALVNQGEGVFYSVNFNETEKFLSSLKSSGFVSDAYLNNFRIYFSEAEETFKKDPINEGPPPGFDYDIVLWTQEPELVIGRASNPTVISSEIKENVAILNLDLVMNLHFELSQENSGWKIDRIVPTEGD